MKKLSAVFTPPPNPLPVNGEGERRRYLSIFDRTSNDGKNTLRYAFLFVLLFLAACIPAKVPDNLDDTPGPPIVITDLTYESSQFTARYPDGWRIVTSEARTPPSVVFVAPDEVTTIRLMIGPLEEGNFSNTELQTEIRGLTLSDGLEMTAILSTPAESFEAMLPIFERVLASTKPT
jgi:hypothetical protein